MSSLDAARARREYLLAQLASVDVVIAELEKLELEKAEWDPGIAGLVAGTRVRVSTSVYGKADRVVNGVVAHNHPDERFVYVTPEGGQSYSCIVFKRAGSQVVEVVDELEPAR